MEAVGNSLTCIVDLIFTQSHKIFTQNILRNEEHALRMQLDAKVVLPLAALAVLLWATQGPLGVITGVPIVSQLLQLLGLVYLLQLVATRGGDFGGNLSQFGKLPSWLVPPTEPPSATARPE